MNTFVYLFECDLNRCVRSFVMSRYNRERDIPATHHFLGAERVFYQGNHIIGIEYLTWLWPTLTSIIIYEF